MNSLHEEPLCKSSDAIDVPTWFRWVSALLATTLIVLPSIFIWKYASNPDSLASPAELGLVQLITLGALLLLFSLAPWRALGLRLRKVGFLEFEQIVTTQAAEHASDFTELRTRLDEVEARVRGLDEIAPISEHLEDVALQPLLLKFLDEFRPTAYSPLRIREWGSRQPGYESLKNSKISSIRRILQKLVSEGVAATRVSKLGNTLYKLAD